MGSKRMTSRLILGFPWLFCCLLKAFRFGSTIIIRGVVSVSGTSFSSPNPHYLRSLVLYFPLNRWGSWGWKCKCLAQWQNGWKMGRLGFKLTSPLRQDFSALTLWWLGPITPCCGDCALYYSVFQNISGLSPDSTVTARNVARLC